jgi:hypothetical protein
MSSITWLDFSDAERKRALQVVELLGRKDSRDELGLGTIRDAFADAMFPGMSTIQRRAAYFLLVPWIFRRIEQRGPRGNRTALERASAHELRLIDVLVADVDQRSDGDRTGIIGWRAGRNLRQLPSMIYWSGLERLGIRRAAGTREQWSRATAAGVRVAYDADGQMVADGARSWWDPGLPDPPEGFPDVASLRLRPQDAEYLRGRILSRCAGTALATLVDRTHPWSPAKLPWELTWLELDEPNATLLEQARRFSEVMNGAALLYNYALAKAFDDEVLTEEYRGALAGWSEREAHTPPPALDAMWVTLDRIDSRHTARTRAFVEQWHEFARNPRAVVSDPRFLECITVREREVKQRKARLSFADARETWRGAAGVAQLEYRWSSTQRQLLDIVSAGAA